MSKIEEVLNGLTDMQREVMELDDLPLEATQYHPNVIRSLETKGLLWIDEEGPEKKINITNLGSDVRGALLSMAKTASPLRDQQAEEDLAWKRHLFGHRFDFPIEVQDVGLRGLELDDVLLDEDLSAACSQDEAGVLSCQPLLHERLVAELAAGAAFLAAADIVDAIGADPAMFFDVSQEKMAELYRIQIEQDAPLPVETCFRIVIPNANDRWPDCPRWLKAYFSVFTSTLMSLYPLVKEERDIRANQIEAIKRMLGEERAKKKAAARLKANQDKLKARIRARQKAPPIKKD
jgi:hypothetical protein